MVLTLNNFTGFETGDLNEALSTSGTPTVGGTDPHSGDFVLDLDAGAEEFDVAIITGGSTDANDDFILGFFIRFSDKNPSSSGNILEVLDDAGTLIFNLLLEPDGDLRFNPQTGAGFTITDPFTLNTYHLIEIRWQHLASAAFDLHIGGVSEISETGIDLTAGGAIGEDLAVYQFGGVVGAAFKIDDIYCFSGGSGVSDFLGNANILRYQANTNSATPDVGDALDQGVWQDLGETPVSGDATEPGWDVNAARGGAVFTDDTQSGDNFRPGPSGDSDFSGTITGGKWYWRLHRGNGGATIHEGRHGNNVDGTADVIFTLGTSFANFFLVREPAAGAGSLPLNTEFFSQGFAKESGGRDIFAEEIFGFLLFVPSTEVPPISPMDQLHPRAARRPSPLAFWIDNLLAVPEEVFTVIRPMPQLLPLPAARAAPMSYWIPNELALPELEFPPNRPMPQLHPRAAPRAAPLQYWITNRLPPEPAPPIRGMDQLHPRERRRAAPMDYWIDNLLVPEEFPPIQPMPQLLPRARRRPAPYTFWFDNWQAVEEAMPPGVQMQVRVYRVNRASPLSYMIQGLIAVQIQPPPIGVAGARGNQADTMVIAVFV